MTVNEGAAEDVEPLLEKRLRDVSSPLSVLLIFCKSIFKMLVIVQIVLNSYSGLRELS